MSDTYRIDLLGFTEFSRDDAARALAAAFGLELSLALDYVDKAPVTVRSGVGGQTARQFAHQLLGLGADVRITSESTGTTAEYNVAELRRASAAHKAAKEEEARAAAERTARASRVAPPAPAEDDVTCPVCSHRQGPGDACTRCGYTFPSGLRERPDTDDPYDLSATDREQEPEYADVDVFERLRSTAEVRALRRGKEEKALLEKLETERRREKVRALFGARKRSILLALVGVLIASTIALVVFSPDPEPEGDPLPEDALPVPPGFTYRRD